MLPLDLLHVCTKSPHVQDPTAVLPDPVTLACRPPDQQFAGSMVYWYNSTSYRDDLAWAASWMYRATRDQARAPQKFIESLNPKPSISYRDDLAWAAS